MVSQVGVRSGVLFAVAATLVAILASPGCAQPLPRSQSGDLTRRMIPPPACILRLPAENVKTSGERRLTEAQLWGLVFRNFDARDDTLPADAIDCRGGHPFSNPVFQSAKPIRPFPFKVQEGDVAFGAGTNKLRVAWFRTHRYPDGSVGGVLALIRTVGDFAELYSIGTFRGHSKRVKLRISRMGSNLLPTVQNDGCLKHPAGSPCDTTYTVYRAELGRLVPAAQFATERIAYAVGTEPGISGRIEYHLVASPVFKKDRINLTEQISVTDAEGRLVHKAEVKRIFSYSQKSGFEPSEESLWKRMYMAVLKKNKTGGSSAGHRAALLEDNPDL